MPAWLDKLAVRALPGTGSGLGMAITNPGGSGRGGVKAATTSSTFTSPGQPLMVDWDAQQSASVAYLGHTYVMRCVRLRAETIAALPFQAGPDPTDPSTVTANSPLARLLGPASPQQPGGPNPTTSARALWCWSIVQRIVTGRMAWEYQTDPSTKQIVGLWPLVSAALDPIPSTPGSQNWFNGFQYRTPVGVIPLTAAQVFYAWRPSIEDWRQPESVLKAAKLPIDIAMACDRYMWSLLKNGMVASKIVIAPPFAEPADRRAWEEQFFSEFAGFDNAGKTIFAEAENDYDSTGKLVDQANVQVVDLSMKSVDAQLLQMIDAAKSDICISLGVPKSLLGDASQRIFANSNAEYRNFWTITAVNDIAELQDDVNLILAPQVGPDVGWFDLSRVTALQPPTIFAPPALTDAINAGVITAEQAADLLNIPSSASTGEDITTAPVGEEATASGAVGGRSLSLRMFGQGSTPERAPEGWLWHHRPLTTYTMAAGTAGWGLSRAPRERVTMGRRSAPPPELATEVMATVLSIRDRRAGKRAEERVAELEQELDDTKAALVSATGLRAEDLEALDRIADTLSESMA
jgi:HK97 family phage portal protein